MKNSTTKPFNTANSNEMLGDGFLIPMLDFVLKINDLIPRDNLDVIEWWGKKLDIIENYAKFLKQPLKLGMFIPCDEDGNVLEEPKISEDDFDEHTTQIFAQYQYDLDRAKENVLFEVENVEYKFGSIYFDDYENELKIVTINAMNPNIDSLASNFHYKLKLSKSALNAIFG